MESFTDEQTCVVEFLKQQTGDEVDEYTALYIAGTLVEADGEDVLEGVLDIVNAACPSFDKFKEEVKLPILLKLYTTVQAIHNAPSSTVCEAPREDIKTKATLEVPVASQQQDNSTNSSSPDIQTLQAVRDQEDEFEPEPAAVDQLLELCQGAVGREFLILILKEQRTIEGAVEWILDAGDHLSAREKAWLARHRQEEDHSKRLKQQLLARFDLQKVPDLIPSSRKGNTKQDVAMWGAGEQQAKAKVRYRDGQAVTAKGEKYIVEKTQEDWDGGSRGKVYTKGKRGKGFM